MKPLKLPGSCLCFGEGIIHMAFSDIRCPICNGTGIRQNIPSGTDLVTKESLGDARPYRSLLNSPSDIDIREPDHLERTEW